MLAYSWLTKFGAFNQPLRCVTGVRTYMDVAVDLQTAEAAEQSTSPRVIHPLWHTPPICKYIQNEW
jgi:hypothetical protein